MTSHFRALWKNASLNIIRACIRRQSGKQEYGGYDHEPEYGEILAEASYPNYDLNDPRDLSLLYTDEQWDKMSEEEQLDAMNSLWRNFCVSDAFEPGSTMKPSRSLRAWRQASLKGMRPITAAVPRMSPGRRSAVRTGTDTGRRRCRTRWRIPATWRSWIWRW